MSRSIVSSKLLNSRFVRSVQKYIPWSKKVGLIILGGAGILVGVVIINPGNIVQKSLNAVGIDTYTDQATLSEEVGFTDQVKTNNPDEDNENPDEDNENKKDDTNNDDSSSEQSQDEPTGSRTVITPEEIQAQKDNGETLLIARSDWNVKINSRSPSSCGTSGSPCSQSETARVNVSPYNVKTGELLPMTECNGNVNKPYSFSDSATTRLIDSYHCEISYKPSSSGMYRLGVELYLSKKVYTDTIYWGDWVWGTSSYTSDGYFVN